uniref:Translocating chain-associated membrane protein n=1 Tax=Xenopsylla cheopis TaxID=163159 RepID=A0A6M2DJK6_XENCH
MVMKPGSRKSSNKNPPILSHEFIIQNHADIVSCVAMLFVVGLMVQATAPIASLFIALHHNISGNEPTRDTPRGSPFQYEAGWKDACAVFFYSLICIVMHAILQEYCLDKISKRLHLSKSKLSKFNESGQLVVFYLTSVVWGADAILREGFLGNISALWEGFPNHPMGFLMKLFFIVQLSYWIHVLPELYFQKIKKEEWSARIQQALCGLTFVGAAYFFNLQRVALCLLVLHYFSEFVFHTIRLVEILDKDEKVTSACSFITRLTFVVVHVATITLSVLTFWYGLAQNEIPAPYVLRIGSLIAVLSLQAFLMFTFITGQLARAREQKNVMNAALNFKSKKESKKDKSRKDKGKREESDLPEVDQNTNKNLRSRTAAQVKVK